MGRRDAVAFTLEWAAEARRYGALVTFEPGWETRGNGTSANYDFGNVHHTGVGSSLARPFPTKGTLIKGRPDLSGPLCNVAGPVGEGDRPHLHVIAAHPANHAGASRASGPVPALALFNPRTFGLEIDYGGNVAMSPGQYLAALIFTRALADVLAGGDVQIVRAHAETSKTGKWDPGWAPGRTIDMTRFRRDAAALIPITEEDPLAGFTRADLLDIVREGLIYASFDDEGNKGAGPGFPHFSDRVVGLQRDVALLRQQRPASPGELAEAVRPLLAEAAAAGALAAAAGGAVSVEEIADGVADRLVARLAS